MAKIGEKTLSEATSLIGALLEDWKEEINNSYLRAEGTFNIDMKLTIKPDNGENDIKASISFERQEKVKDSAHGKVNEDQQDLFPEEN